MAISRARKEELVSQYVDLLDRSEAIFFTEYKGMSVKQVEDMRSKIREKGGAFHVTKNTLLRVALEQTDRPTPADLLNSQTAVSFALDDAPGMAKMLVEETKDDDFPLVLRGGLLDQSVMNSDQIESLSKMPSKQELQVKLLGLMLSPARNLVTVMNAPARDLVSVMNNSTTQLVNVLQAYVQKQEQENA